MEHAHDPTEFDSLIDAGVDLTRPQPIETPWGVLALFRVDGAVICVQAFCPHLQGPLFQGSVAAGEVTCPWHLWRFDLRTGRRTDWKNPHVGQDARGLLVSAVRIGPSGSLLLSRPVRLS
ncbi:MAG: Rieske 2Fe-2S domain-containing protein [Planctomycetota bacterium]